MTLILDSACEIRHTGSICSGYKVATHDTGINTFVFIEGNLIMVEGSAIDVASHSPITCSGLESHSFSMNDLAQDFIFVEDKKIGLVGDGYSSDSTLSVDAGANTFVKYGVPGPVPPGPTPGTPITVSPVAKAQFFITSNVLEDSEGSYTMSQNNSTNKVISESVTINNKIVTGAYFSGTGTSGGSTNDGTSPNGDYPNLYRSGNIMGNPTNLTVAYWFKTTGENATNTTQFHVYERATWYGFTQLCQISNSHATVPGRLSAYYGQYNYSCVPATSVARLDEWVHVGFRKVGSTLYLYQNGILIATTSGNSAGSASSLQFRLGCSRSGAQHTVGYMHDVRVWSVDAGASVIQQLAEEYD